MIVQATNTLASTPDRFYLFSWKYSRGEDESVVPENEIIGESSVFILAHFKNSSSLKSLEEHLLSKEEKEEEEHFHSSWIFCEIKKGREGRSRISQWKQTCVPSAIERNARAEISFHLGDSVKNSPGRAHGPRFKGRKSGFIRFFSFSLSSATSFSSPLSPPPFQKDVQIVSDFVPLTSVYKQNCCSGNGHGGCRFRGWLCAVHETGKR